MTNCNQFILTNINGGREITFKFEEEMLYNVLPHFKEFLRGCGYYFDGELDIVEPVDPAAYYDDYPEDMQYRQDQLDLFDSLADVLAEEPVVFWKEQNPTHVDSEGGLE